jgi:predicted DNA-binding transcriptional regulator AlpA
MRRASGQQLDRADEGWPPRAESRGWGLAEAAAYLGLSPARFERHVAEGLLPRPLPLGRRGRVWDRLAIDRALDRMSGLGTGTEDPTKPRDALPIHEAIRQRKAARASRRTSRGG